MPRWFFRHLSFGVDMMSMHHRSAVTDTLDDAPHPDSLPLKSFWAFDFNHYQPQPAGSPIRFCAASPTLLMPEQRHLPVSGRRG